MIGTEDEARSFCAAFTDDQGMVRLAEFTGMLEAENRQQNLISAASLESVWQRHIADSLQLLLHVPRETGAWLDLGSGAGMPEIGRAHV